ncbi:MAG: hypothetical protein LV481_10095 [Methylacidiphilales bacterium]|nr:hypothetical protein [Candidatus Methylacidiphilales bacterium]
MSEPSPSDDGSGIAQQAKPKRWASCSSLCSLVFIGFFILCCVGVFLGPVTPNLKKALQSQKMQTSHAIALVMFQYANDHNGNYPDGKSSTEVFQKLIDGGYITDPLIFYVQMTGKTKPTSLRLKPENVCWDVTSTPDGSTSDELPLVFLTGYKVNYVPGGAAVPLMKPEYQGIAVCYKSNNASFVVAPSSTAVNPDGSIPNFVPADFNPQGKTYRQLTPDGVLPDK